MILLPGIGVGFHEILRQPMPNTVLRTISREATGTRIHDVGNEKRRYLGFTYLSFGLDVLPNLALKIPDNICIKLLVVIPYIVFMALWFPFLPFIQ